MSSRHEGLGRVRTVAVHGTFIMLLIATGYGWSPVAVSAQSTLETVDRLTRVGRTEEARAQLLEWWDGERGDASRRDLQRGLWLRGRLTVDPVQAGLDFQRLALLYPSGEFTPDALFRLAQAAWAMGDEAAARRHLGALDQDYRRTGAWERAQAWIPDAGPLPPSGDTPTPVAESAAVESRETPDAPQSSPEKPSGSGEPRPAPTAAASDVPVMNYFVQFGAFADLERARALFDEMAARDIDVRLVRVTGSQFAHVRAGRFADRSAAVELLELLTAQGVSAALVRDDRAEVQIEG